MENGEGQDEKLISNQSSRGKPEVRQFHADIAWDVSHILPNPFRYPLLAKQRMPMVNRDSPPRRARRWYVQSDVGELFPNQTMTKRVAEETGIGATNACGLSGEICCL